MARYAVKIPVSYPTIDVVAAAIMAYRANGDRNQRYDMPSCRIESADDETTETVALISNRTLTTRYLKENTITDEARAEAVEMIQALQTDMTFKLLTGKAVSSFIKDMTTVLNDERTPEFRIGLLSYVPSTFDSLRAAEKRLEEEISERYTSKALGLPGQKVMINFTIINKRYVETLGCFSVFGKDDAGNLISFFTSHEDRCVSGKITGKVKFANPDRFHGDAIVSNLNFVKLVG